MSSSSPPSAPDAPHAGPTAVRPAAADPVAALRGRLAAVSVRDAARFGRRLDALGSPRDRSRGPARAQELERLGAQVDAAVARLVPRAVSVPAITYPEALPVSARRAEIAAAIRDHQVVVVAGETGSGKTTQIPKIALELGRGVRGMIGHTQPRRIAARAVAERVAEELGTEVGGAGAVGYAVRFTDEVGPNALVKLMTDGILLAEIARDRDLLGYDTLIIDEAHERSLTIDFLLGYLHRLLPRRPDLKVVITSATIDPQRFADHFATAVVPAPGGGPAVPVVEVSGRTYPVQVRYRPLVVEAEAPVDGAEEAEDDPDDSRESDEGSVRDQTEGVLDAVLELAAEGDRTGEGGDVLVFLSGEREIRDTADALERLVETDRRLRGTEVLPLFGRLSAAEQHRVFAAHTARRVVLATNVAETSLTVPGIRYVVDTGTARISRYSTRTKVQRLPIEAISRASADQRAGRCGRVADGICIRLYSEADYEARPRFTDPEVQRTSLASVILSMASLDLGPVDAFPFLDAPDARQVRDGVALLHELGAYDPDQVDPRQRLTALGRRLAGVPVDPRLARMLVEADRLGVAAEVAVVVAALSVQDVRERPLEAAEAAAASHRRFADDRSDLLSVLNLWNHLGEQADALSSSAFRRMCKAEFLHYLRIREWQDLHAQLRRVLRGLGVDVPRQVRSGGELDAVRDQVHQALLSGLLSQIGLKDERADAKRGGGRGEGSPKRRGPAEYAGARGARFAIAPGSVLARRSPAWVMAGELVETSRTWARQVAALDPAWIEELAPHLVVRSYGEPRWEARRAAAVATERVTLYGLPVVAGRTVGYAAIDPELSRELFVRHALVGGQWSSSHAFRAANTAVLEQVEEISARTRRRDLLADDDVLFRFYDARVPADVVSGRHFDAWWRRERPRRPDLLTLDLAAVLGELDAAAAAQADAPTSWSSGSFDLDLSYRFEPGHESDGVTVHVPLAVLDQVSAADLTWGVPAFRGELVTALLRALPKALRVQLVPVPDTARELLGSLPTAPPAGVSLTEALGEQLRARRGVLVPAGAWDWSKVPDHLRPRYSVEDDAGAAVAAGKDLDALRGGLEPARRAAVRSAVTAAAPGLEVEDLTGWPTGHEEGLPASVERVDVLGRPVTGYPALVVEPGAGGAPPSVALRVLASEAEARAASPAAVRALARASLPSAAALTKGLLDGLATPARLALARSPHGSAAALLADCADAAVDALVTEELARTAAARGRDGGPVAPGAGGVASAAEFTALVAAVRPQVARAASDALALASRVLSSAREVEKALDGLRSLSLAASGADARAQLAALVRPGFVAATGLGRLPDLQRYLRALLARATALAGADAAAVARDRDRAGVLARLAEQLEARAASLAPARRAGADVVAVRWQLQELRVSLFAQGIGTPSPVSEKRVLAAIAALGR